MRKTRIFLSVLLVLSLLVSGLGGRLPKASAAAATTLPAYPLYVASQGDGTTVVPMSPFAVYVSFTGFVASSTTIHLKAYSPTTASSYAYNWAGANGWLATGGAWASYPNVSSDASGNGSGWIYVMLPALHTGATTLVVAARDTANHYSPAVNITGLDMTSGTGTGGWISGTAYLADAITPAPGKIVVVKNGASIIGTYATEDNSVNDGYAATPGTFKVAAPVGTGYTVEIWDPVTNTIIGAQTTGIAVTAGGTTPDVVINGVASSAPTLDWTGESNYLFDGLNPEMGSNLTTFIYRVKYTDADNDTPQFGYPAVHILKSSVEIAGSPFAMSAVDAGDTTYTDGKLYTYSTTLMPGDYSYSFEAKDLGGANATGTPTATTAGPTLSGDSTPPDIFGLTPPRYSTIYETKPTISADFSDESSINMSSVLITVDGVDVRGFSTVITPTDVTYVPAVDLALGTHTIAVSVSDDVGNTKNVSWYFSVIQSLTTPGHYLGNLHSHTSYSDGALTPADAFAYARDTANVDFLAITDHSNSLTADEWADTQAQAGTFTQNGSFVGLAGFEYTQTAEGHMNVYNTSTYVSRSDVNYDTLAEFYAWLKTQPDAISQFNHPFTLQDFGSFAYDAAVDQKVTLQEVGNGSPPYSYARLEASYIYALDKGWHVGATNNQDNHAANWGYPPNNLTGIVASSLTSADVLAAMKAMRTYGTEDRNLQLSFLANGYWMGSTIPALEGETINFHVELVDPDSADTIASAQIITTGGRILASTTGSSNNVSWDYAYTNPGGGNWYYLKTVEADGDIAISSPIWTPPSDVDLRVTNLTSSPLAAFPNDPLTLTATVNNFGLFAYSALDVNFYLGNPAEGGALIGTGTVDVAVGGSDTVSIPWTPTASGNVMVYAVLSGPPDDPVVDNTAALGITVIQAIGRTVLIDRYHNNDYTSSTGLYNMTEVADLLKNNGYKVLENSAPFTTVTLQDVDLLIIPYPQSGTYRRDISVDEQAAISAYVANGGALLFGGKSNFGEDPTRYNDFLTSMGIGINLNSDNVYDDVNNYGYQWSLNVLNFPDTPSGIGDDISNVRFFSGESLITPARTPLVSDPAQNIEVLGFANQTSWDEDDTTNLTHVTSGYYTYSYHSNPDGSQIPVMAVQTLPTGARVGVLGRSIFSNYELGNWVDEQAACNNEAFTLNLVDWLCSYTRVVSIAEAREDLNSDGIPDKLGQTVTVEGVVTAGSGTFFDVIYLQDATGGITIFGTIPSDKIIPLGAVLQIKGVVDAYNGDIELQFSDFADDFIWVGWTTEPVPRAFTTGALDHDENEGWLVKTEGFVTQIIDASTCVIDDGSGPIVVFIDGYIGTLPAGLKVGDYLSVIGLSGEYADGRRVRVRNAGDVSAVVTYTLTYTAGANGTITGTTPQTVGYGASGTLVTAVPNAGYHFVSWSDGILTAARTDTNVTVDITVTANFAINTYTLTVNTVGSGTVAKSPDQALYGHGSFVTLTATPASGYTFIGWSGNLSGMTNPATITMTGNKTVTASFTALPTYTLTPSAGPGGTIAPNTPQTVSQGSSKYFAITPSAGYHVLDVTVDGSSVGPVTIYTFTNVQASHTIHATFAPDAYTLTVTPPVNGTVTKDPDQATYAYGTSVILTATPSPGYLFTGWSGSLTGSTNPGTVTMNGNRTITATFTAIPTYTLTVTPSPLAGGSVAKSPDASSYALGTVVTLTATPALGYTFTGWSGGLTGTTNPVTITMDGNKTVTATFAVAPARTLTVSVVGSGFVVKSPNQSSYPSGTVVTLTAYPLAGSTFTGWSGDLTGSTNPTTITMDVNKVVTATFAPIPSYVLTTTSLPSMGGTIGKSPNQSSYPSGTVVTLSAYPHAGYTFTGWSGDLTGSTNPTTITMDANKTVTATFAPVFSISLSSGWNLISVPVPLPVASIPGLLFVYGYHDVSSWSVPMTLLPGEGYWVQVQNAVTVLLTGTPETAPVTLTYLAGWQLLGNPFDVPLPISNITNHELITTCYSYDPQSGWGVVDLITGVLQPGKGYWIQLSGSTSLTLIHP